MDIDYSSNTLTIGDLKARIAYLADRFLGDTPAEDDVQEVWDEWEELKALRDAAGDLSYCWNQDNTTLINETYWRDYCEEYCYNIGDISRDGIVAQFVDWDRVANVMFQDYRLVTIQGNDFNVRT